MERAIHRIENCDMNKQKNYGLGCVFSFNISSTILTNIDPTEERLCSAKYLRKADPQREKNDIHVRVEKKNPWVLTPGSNPFLRVNHISVLGFCNALVSLL